MREKVEENDFKVLGLSSLEDEMGKIGGWRGVEVGDMGKIMSFV